MSMRYKEVRIPAGAREAFEAFVSDINGTFRPGIPTREAPQLWREQTQDARDLLDQFRGPHNPQTEEAITNGLRQLIQDSYTQMYSAGRGYTLREKPIPIKSDIDWDIVKKEVTRYFNASLAPERAQLYHVNVPHGQPTLVPTHHDRYLSPRQVAIALQTYGLTTGERIPTKAIMQKNNFKSDSPIKGDLFEARAGIILNEAIRGLVLEPSAL